MVWAINYNLRIVMSEVLLRENFGKGNVGGETSTVLG